jgi:hypothetical protein
MAGVAVLARDECPCGRRTRHARMSVTDGWITGCFSEGENARPCRCLAPQTWSIPDCVGRTFEQCVSPSLSATAATGPCIPRKSQAVITSTRSKEQSEPGIID